MRVVTSCMLCVALWGCGAERAEETEEPDEETPGCVPSPAGLQARWRGEMTAGDDTGRYNATLVSTQFTAGRHGSAFLFDGAQSVVTADGADALWPAGSFSIEAWVNVEAVSGEFASVVQKFGCGGAVCDPSTYELTVDSNGNPKFAYQTQSVDSRNRFVEVKSLINLIQSGWHHLVAVRNLEASQLQLYVDGKLESWRQITGLEVQALSNGDTASDPITIGAATESGKDTRSAFFRGAIDDVAIYYGALGAGEIAAIHKSADGVCE